MLPVDILCTDLFIVDYVISVNVSVARTNKEKLKKNYF